MDLPTPTRPFSLAVMLHVLLLFLAFAFLPATPAQAATITVSGTAEQAGKLSISFQNFRGDASTAAQEFISILRNDLQLSGYFRPTDQTQAAVTLDGMVRGTPTGISVSLRASWLAETRTNQWQQQADFRQLRDAAHSLADTLIQEITGHPSMASSKILFIGRRSGSTEVYVCDADGAGIRQLTSDRKPCLSPNWIPNRNAFTYTSWLSGVPAAYTVNVNDNRRSRLSAKPGMNQGAVVSPHGDRAAIILSYAGTVDLYLVNARDGHLLDRLTRQGGNEASPSWSPDGRSLVYVTDSGKVPHCVIQSLSAGSRPKRLVYANHIRENVAPEWGNNGKITFCGRTAGRYCIYTIDATIDPRLAVPTLVSPNDGCDYEDPSWAPDGRHIICTRTANYRKSLVVLDTLGDPPRPLFNVPGEWYLPSWSQNNVSLLP